MQIRLFLFIAWALLCQSGRGQETFTPDPDVFAKERPNPPIVRGFMMSESFSQKDCFDAKSWGANVIRMQLFPVRFADRQQKDLWEALPQYLEKIKQQVQYAVNADLKVVIDLHQPPFQGVRNFDQSAFWNREDLEGNFCRIWSEIARQLLPYKEHIWGYDLLNEPLDRSQLPGVTKQWYPIAVKIIKAIRKIDQETWIIFEPGPGSLFTGFNGLEPLPDPRIIYSGHFYEPQDFTHQGVFNISGTDLDEAKEQINIAYPGVVKGRQWDKEKLTQLLQAADAFQAKWKVPIYVGEFSVIRWAPRKAAVTWLQDALSLFEERGWSWTYHAFREWPGWSLEHDEQFWMEGMPAPKPLPAGKDTERGRIIKQELQKNHVTLEP